MASSSNAGAGSGTDSEGEEQEDPSSSLGYATEALKGLKLDNENKDSDELAAFRQQWQRELGATPSPQREPPGAPHGSGLPVYEEKNTEGSEESSAFRQPTPPPDPAPPPEPLSEEEKAKQLFREGVELERRGKLYEAIQHYKRAMQILPDVEKRLYESADRGETPEGIDKVESEAEEESRVERAAAGAGAGGEALLARLRRVRARGGVLCEPAVPNKECYLSWLPPELVAAVLRWVVGSELDAAALERLGAACRGLFVAARDPDLWRAMCLRTWGKDCGTPRAHGLSGWRHMFLRRPRPLLHGCYISKTSYLRPGENSFQDQTYRPWYLVDYYRYLRFFSDGAVLMWTTAEEPAACVAQLRRPARAGALPGRYRLVGDKVLIIVKKSNEKKPAQPTHTRFRSRRKEPHENHETTFHLELQIRAVRGRGNWQLAWRGYAVATRREPCTQFDLSPATFPPFAFSRVRAYTATATAPLE